MAASLNVPFPLHRSKRDQIGSRVDVVGSPAFAELYPRTEALDSILIGLNSGIYIFT